MLRGLVALLLLANLAFLGWSQGWLAALLPPPHAGEREPGRIASQVHPELVRVLNPAAAAPALEAAHAAARACIESGPYTDASVAAAEALLTQQALPAGSWTRAPVAPPPLFLVYAGRLTETAARHRREEELRQLQLPYEVLSEPAEYAGGFVLSRHATRADAEAALAALPAALKGVRVVELPAPPPQYMLRLAQADSDTQTRLRALAAPALVGGFRICAGTP
ncbi:MAG: hypothetical protein KGL18_12015 [Burkholderiales bacterium]|nr:hypothetical protein [Burkholderiales bacterium]MDE1926395.1 hypothetical protein [Burkholderiales bacterium]MDE2157348.1 hypothetical protein [Burkholderiales bacterium]MDE2503682.1 hypothetical protein [Burkholderiales bacterium]